MVIWAKLRTGYFGANGGFGLSRDYAESVVDIADQLQGAVADNLLGQLCAWPLCPDDGHLQSVRVVDGDDCVWMCERGGGHAVGVVGGLRGAEF